MSSLKEHVEKLDCHDEAERIYAAEDIGYLNTPDGIPALLGRLAAEPSRAVRDAIFQALTRTDGEGVIRGCISLLGSDDPQLRNQAVEVLRRKGEASVPFLAEVMRHGDKDLRKLVLDVLSGMETSAAEGIYAAALQDADSNIVITAVENLGRTRSAHFRVPIEETLRTAFHPMLVGACLEALGGIGNELSLPAIRTRFPELRGLPGFFLVSCLKAMGSLGAAAEFSEVAALLPDCYANLRPAILSALTAIQQRYPEISLAGDLLPTFEGIVNNGDPPLCRYQAVRALGLLFPVHDVTPFLTSCLTSYERLVRLGAIEALQAMAPPGLQKVLAARALSESDEDVLQALNC